MEALLFLFSQGLILTKPSSSFNKRPLWDKLSIGRKVVSMGAAESGSVRAVEVRDYKGKGMETVNGMHRNLAEAEYLVALYMYLRLKGHAIVDGKVELRPLDVLIVATEEGQRRLIVDLLKQKCSWHPLLGLPERPVVLPQELAGQCRADLALVSTVWTAGVRGSLGFLSAVEAKEVIVFTRGEVFEAVREEAAEGFSLEDGTAVNDFRQMYKVVEKVLT